MSRPTTRTEIKIDPALLERIDRQCMLNTISRSKFIEIATKRLLAEVEED